MSPNGIRLTKWAALVFVLAAVTGFAGLRYYHTGLCNGYELVRMNGYEVVIANPKNIVVTRGTVTLFDVRSPYVIGYTDSWNMAPDTDPVDGWFVLDTKSGTIADGLSEDVWKQRLATLKWQRPRLRKPW